MGKGSVVEAPGVRSTDVMRGGEEAGLREPGSGGDAVARAGEGVGAGWVLFGWSKSVWLEVRSRGD